MYKCLFALPSDLIALLLWMVVFLFNKGNSVEGVKNLIELTINVISIDVQLPGPCFGHLFCLLANCFCFFFCSDLAVLIFTTPLADIQRPNWKSAQGPWMFYSDKITIFFQNKFLTKMALGKISINILAIRLIIEFPNQRIRVFNWLFSIVYTNIPVLHSPPMNRNWPMRIHKIIPSEDCN